MELGKVLRVHCIKNRVTELQLQSKYLILHFARSLYIIKVTSAGLIHNQREGSIQSLDYITLYSNVLLRRLTKFMRFLQASKVSSHAAMTKNGKRMLDNLQP